jgi:Xaa-Pro dipeptidase
MGLLDPPRDPTFAGDFRGAPPPMGSEERKGVVVGRLDAVRVILERRQLAAALLAARRNFAWLTAGGSNHVATSSETGAAPILVTRDWAAVIAPVNEADRLRDEELGGTGLAMEVVPWDPAAPAHRAAELAVDDPIADDAALEADVLPVRTVLRPFEVERMAWLATIAGSSVEAALRDAVGATELELAAEVSQRVTLAGARTPVLLAAADERIVRYRHPLPSSAEVRSRAMLVLVAERWGLHVAVTRFRELQPPDEDLDRRWATVRGVLDAMLAASRPSATLGEVLAIAEQAYERAGFGEEPRFHHHGGIIGYQARERIATTGDSFALQPGMAVAWNPSVAGVKLEATAVLEPDGDLRLLT